MGVISRWRYRILFAFAMVYMAVSCIVACALLWNTSVTRLPSPAEVIHTSEHNSLVPACNTSKDLLDDPLLDCSLLDRLSYEKFIAHGWTKIVHKAKLDDGASIAIKTVNINGKDVNDCSRAETLIVCHNKATEKLVREIQLLKKLNHENIIQLKHYCSKIEGADGCMKYAVIGTEIGETLSNLKLLQMTWRERKQVIQDLIRLIHYSSTLSPLGTLGLADLRRPQFILVKGRLKLADLDDIIIGEPTCSSISDCSGLNITIHCISGADGGRCSGYNMKLNIQKSFREFGPYIFIPEGVPKEKRTNLDNLRQLWRDNLVPTDQLLSAAMSL